MIIEEEVHDLTATATTTRQLERWIRRGRTITVPAELRTAAEIRAFLITRADSFEQSSETPEEQEEARSYRTLVTTSSDEEMMISVGRPFQS
jgi:hypothetical protein